MEKKYYLGLDIGTNSVGWAVTDENYQLCKFRGKEMWGIRLFESANTASDRRLKRHSRRRLKRRTQRIKLLQEIFAEEIGKVDSTFFIRLNESKLHMEDKSVKEKYPLFISKEYNDVNYYKQYPTIYHLRKELISNSEPHDPRLVYLALHHILKNRGHFLIDGSLSESSDFNFVFGRLHTELLNELNWTVDIESNNDEIRNILLEKSMSKIDKLKEIKKILKIDAAKTEEEKRQAEIAEVVFKFILGNKGDLEKLFELDKKSLEISSFSFAEDDYEGKVRLALEEDLPEKLYIIDLIKNVYDWRILENTLKGAAYISDAKVLQYEKHKENLRLLKKLIYENFGKEVYKEFFVESNLEKVLNNYSAYVGHADKNGKKIDSKKNDGDKFFKEIKSRLESIEESAEGYEIAREILAMDSIEEFLPLQRSKSNGVIPNQIHKAELIKILDNAELYMPFLKEVDADGISNKEKIISIFEFRIPYFVGPLSDRHRKEGAHNWMVRREGQNGKIYPWNIEKIVDYEKSNEEFINRMTNKCTYLIGEDVLPKNSLLYSKYMVLNELNNLKVRGNKISEKVKQGIYQELFQNRAKVTGKMVLEHLRKDIPDLEKEDLSGFDNDFKTSLKAYLDFKKQIFGDDIDKIEVQKIVEDIIRWITIYGSDSKMIKNVILKHYPNVFTEEKLKKVAGFRYSGWGNFSQKFLSGIEGMDCETGEVFNLIDALWQTNNNLMQLLSKNFTFVDEIDKVNNQTTQKIEKVSYEELVDGLYVSPANKRAIWQSIQISEEIKKIMGCEPDKIFVEMARGGGEKNKRTTSRKEAIKALYKSCDEDVRALAEELDRFEERDLSSMKLYLYFTQMGRCMYTGESIDLEELLQGNDKWDRDHIYPQSKIKDDSIDNLVLVRKNENANKGNGKLDTGIQTKMHNYWRSLLKKGFISQKKYDRLTRKSEFSNEELAGFINRQLVETRQSSKAVAELLKQLNEKSQIVYVKAQLASDFRKHPLNMLKSRRVNDYHHGKDAYLNIVVGNVYDAQFTSNPLNWFKKNRDTEYSINKVFHFDVKIGDKVIWEKFEEHEENGAKIAKGGTLETVRKVMSKDNLLYTEYTYCEKGKLFDETLQRKGKKNVNIKLKSNLDVAKYGGYEGVNTSYFSLVEFDGKKGQRVKNIIGVPIYIANILEHKATAFKEYCENIRGMKNVEVLVPKIKKNTLMVVNGFEMRIRGESGTGGVNLVFKSAKQLHLDSRDAEIIRRIEKYLEKNREKKLNEAIDKISNEDLNHIYDVLLCKLSTVYDNRPSNKSKFIQDARDKFYEIGDLSQKAEVIDQIVNFMRCDISTTANLEKIGGSKGQGAMAVKKNTVCKEPVEIINQSVTGLFETRLKL